MTRPRMSLAMEVMNRDSIHTSVLNQSVLDLGELNLDSLKEHEEDFDLNAIFKRLYPKDDYSRDTSCFVCIKKKKSILGIQQLENCAFCGRRVCKDCSPKKRPNPRPPKKDEYFRICKICDQEYIRRPSSRSAAVHQDHHGRDQGARRAAQAEEQRVLGPRQHQQRPRLAGPDRLERSKCLLLS